MKLKILYIGLGFLFIIGLIALTSVNYATGEENIEEIKTTEDVEIEESNYFTIPRNDDWLCFDYATAYMEENPEYGILIVTNSDNTYFDFYNGDENANHAVNYKINVNKSLTYHDEMYYVHYDYVGWQYEKNNWYFTPEGFENSWDYLLDNKQEIYNEL